MVDELDRQPRELSKTETIKAVMKHSGATVTMTTVSDLVVFAVGTSTSPVSSDKVSRLNCGELNASLIRSSLPTQLLHSLIERS